MSETLKLDNENIKALQSLTHAYVKLKQIVEDCSLFWEFIENIKHIHTTSNIRCSVKQHVV